MLLHVIVMANEKIILDSHFDQPGQSWKQNGWILTNARNSTGPKIIKDTTVEPPVMALIPTTKVFSKISNSPQTIDYKFTNSINDVSTGTLNLTIKVRYDREDKTAGNKLAIAIGPKGNKSIDWNNSYVLEMPQGQKAWFRLGSGKILAQSSVPVNYSTEKYEEITLLRSPDGIWTFKKDNEILIKTTPNTLIKNFDMVRLFWRYYGEKQIQFVRDLKITFSGTLCLPSEVGRKPQFTLNTNLDVYRNGPVKITARFYNWEKKIVKLVISEKQAFPESKMENELFSGTVPVTPNSIRLLDDFNDPSLPGIPEMHLGSVYPSLKRPVWEVGNRRYQSVLLSNTANDDGPKYSGGGAIRMRYLGGAGAKALRNLKASVRVDANRDYLSVYLYGSGMASKQQVKLILQGKSKLGKEYLYSNFDLIPKQGKHQGYISTRVLEGIMEDAIKLDFKGWKKFSIPLRAFIPFPEETSPSAISPKLLLSEITGFGFLFQGQGDYYADEITIRDKSELEIKVPEKILEWEICGEKPGKYKIYANADNIKTSNDIALCGPRGKDVDAKIIRGPYGMIFSINGKSIAPVFHTGDIHCVKAAVPKYASGGINIECFDLAQVTADRDWLGEHDFNNFRRLDEYLRRIFRANPRAFVMFRLQLLPPKWWLDSNPGERVASAKGPWLSGTARTDQYGPSLASEKYQEFAKRYLAALVKHIRAGRFGDRIIGYWVMLGHSGESWHHAMNTSSPLPGRYPEMIDYSDAMKAAFKKFLKQKYGDNVTRLRHAWRDSEITFETAEIPSEKARKKSGTVFGIFRKPTADSRIIDYDECHNQVVVNLIQAFTHTVKKESDHKNIVGVMAAYNCAGLSDVEGGHANFADLMRLPELDFISSTFSYFSLYPGGASVPRHSVTSVNLHNKLFVSEIDHTINLRFLKIPVPHEGASILCEELIKRDMVQSFVQGAGVELYDISKRDGAYTAPNILNKIIKIRDLEQREIDNNCQAKKTHTIDGLAVIWDNRLNYYTAKASATSQMTSWGPCREMVCEIPFTGCKVDYYDPDDLEIMPDYPVILFYMNMPLTDNQIDIIKKRFEGDNHTLIWIYPPGVISENGINLERAFELTGIPVKYAGIYSQTCRIVNFDDSFTKSLLNAEPRSPELGQHMPYWPNCLNRKGKDILFASIGEFHGKAPEVPLFTPLKRNDVKVLAVLQENDEPAIALRRYKNWTSVYSAVNYLPAEFLREICRDAGVTIYDSKFDALWVNDRWLGVHIGQRGGKRTFHVPKGITRVKEVFSGKKTKVTNGTFKTDLTPLTTYLWELEKQ